MRHVASVRHPFIHLAALTSILVKVGIEGVNSNLATAIFCLSARAVHREVRDGLRIDRRGNAADGDVNQGERIGIFQAMRRIQ